MIGNSFSEDTVRYVYDIARSAGIEKVLACNMYIGGCSIDTHFENAKSNAAAYDFQVYENGEWAHHPGKTLEYGIEFADWNIISLQQASGFSGIPSSYVNLQNLMDYVKSVATNPDFEFAWNMTWAYQSDSAHGDFAKYDHCQISMYNAIIDSVKSQVLTKNFDYIIPNGTAIQNARASFLGDTLTRDGFHLSYDIGRYIAGLTLVCALCKVNAHDVGFAPDGVTDKQKNICAESVVNAIKSPLRVADRFASEN